jgi:sugar phosphate permease
VLDQFNKSELGIYLFTLYIGAMSASLVGGHVNIRSDIMVQYGVVVTGIGALVTVVHPIGFALIGVGSGLGLLGLVNGIARLDVERGFTMGIFNTCTYGGLAILPVLAGFSLPILTHRGVIIITGVILLLIAMLPLKMLKE